MKKAIDTVDYDKPLSSRVEALAGYGLPAADIACVLEIEEGELQADYAHELLSGGIKANARVAESLYRKALGDGREGVTAAIFWLKTRARWKETSVHEIADGRPSSDLTTWTDEMLQAAIEGLQPEVARIEDKAEQTVPDRRGFGSVLPAERPLPYGDG